MPNNTNNQKKYASLSTLQTFLDNLKTTFSSLSHKHTISDITDYKVDSELSSTSTAPVQNKVLNAEFDEIAVSMRALDLAIDGKADSSHSHNDIYYTETEIDQKLSGKANATHSHAISEVTNLQSTLDTKVPTSRTINSKPLTANVTLSASDVGAAPASHDHNDLYYTETEIDTKLAGKSDKNHNHDSAYDPKGAAAESLASAKSYTDTKTANLASTTVVDNKISSHNTATTAHSDIRDLISGLTTRLNTLANSDDTTLDQMSEVVAYIKNNKSLIDGITTSKVNVSDIVNNLTTNVSNKPLSAAQGVAIKALIDDLQEELDTHSADIIKHITSDERTNWNAAKTLAENALPTSGGTMTGAITMTQANLVKRDKDTSNVAIYGGTDSANGATITVYGKEQAIYPGYFSLKANNGEASASLEGRPDGTLKWNGKNIVALGTSEALPISSGGTGATKASDALENLGGLPKSNPSVTGSFSMNKLHSSTTGLYSVVEGYNCSATGDYGAHAEGYYSEANGDNSHAEGDGAIANGVGAHAEGYKTIASEDYSHVQGKYNIEDTENQYAHIVGNGTSNSNRSNAHTLDWDGNAWFAGNVYIGGESQDEGSKLLTYDDLNWSLIYDSGEISAIANSISNINVSGYTKFRVVVRCYNDGDSYGDRTGSAIFKAQNGKSYQFPVWTNMFSKSISTVSAMADFELTDDWLVCPHASRLVGEIDIFDTVEGGTAGNLTSSGSGILKCTSPLSTLTISSLDQNSNYYFGMGSRVMVWGWNA